MAEIVWVRFSDDKIGQLLRNDSTSLLQRHKPNDKLAVPIMKQRKSFPYKQGNTSYIRDQFPLTLCYAITVHKSQGQTLEEVLIDFTDENMIKEGSFYTAMSRVKFGDNLYLREFKSHWIKANVEAEAEVKKMKLYQNHVFKKIQNTETIFDEAYNEVKIGYININDLSTSKSTENLNQDQNILGLDYLAIADTRLSRKDDDERLKMKLSNWSIEKRFDADDNSKHMGLLFLRSNKSKYQNLVESIEQKYEVDSKKSIVFSQTFIVTFTKFDLKAAFLYIREKPSMAQITNMKSDLSKCDLIMGDMNLDPADKADLKKLAVLCGDRKMILNEFTTIRYNQLDHIILNCDKFGRHYSTSYINYTTDHSLICVRIPELGNIFNDAYLKRMSFDVEKHTKTQSEKPRNFSQNIQKRSYEEEIIDIEKEENEQNSNSIVDINLDCLSSPNWLTGTVIDSYLSLLMKVNENIFAYSTIFYASFTKNGFERVKKKKREENLFSYSKILIPIHKVNHWFLVVFDKKKLSAYDPYNYPDPKINAIERQQLLKENKEYLMDILSQLKDDYLRPLFQKYNKSWYDVEMEVQIPPEIPSQDNDCDCGVFLLMFAKYIVLEKKFDFATEDMIQIRDEIREELNKKSITTTVNVQEKEIKEPTLKSTGKRKCLPDHIDERPAKKQTPEKVKPVYKLSRKRKALTKQRCFLNPDGESCWLNTVLQMILTALDSENSLSDRGSLLWRLLVSLKKSCTTRSLNPMDVKKLLIKTDIERLKCNNLPKSFSAFGLPETNEFDLTKSSEQLSSKRIGQQDCQDFFRCLNTNRDSWPDVSNLFSISTVTETKCDNCNSIVQRESIEGELYLTLNFSPHFNMSMNDHLKVHFDSYAEEIKDRRDEEGCGKKCKAWRRTRLADVQQTNYILIFVNRFHPGIIHKTEFYVEKNSKINITDVKGNAANFIPLAILHYEGSIQDDGSTLGHYRADVKHIESGQWYRTSDNEEPECLGSKELSNQGTVFLYKRIQ